MVDQRIRWGYCSNLANKRLNSKSKYFKESYGIVIEKTFPGRSDLDSREVLGIVPFGSFEFPKLD